MTADARPFTEAAEGTGPAVLDYRGPQGWATVVHRSDRGDLTHRVGLSGPQRLRIEYAGQWSVSVTPLEQDEVEDGGFFSRHGIGNQTVDIVKPRPDDPDRAAILEFTTVVRCPSAYPALHLCAADGHRLHGLNHWDMGGDRQARYLIDGYRPAGEPPVGRVEVVDADNCEWRLRVLPLSAARPMETITTGTGADVLVRTGPLGAVTLRHTNGSGNIRTTGLHIESRRHYVRLSAYPTRPFDGGKIIGILPEPTLLQVTGDGDWELRVIPLDELRTFDREIGGTVGEVVRYTGPPAIARVITRSWRKWGGLADAQTLTPELTDVRWVLAQGGPLARFRPKKLELLPGMLVAVSAPWDGSGWRIRAKAKAGAGAGEASAR
jgi:hypothetical protein